MTREELKPGDILLFPPVPFSIKEPLTVLGHIIIKITNGKVSHAAIYCGEINGKQTVAHADLPGISSLSLQELLDEEPIGYVFRHAKYEQSCPVDTIAINYTEGENPYPKLNLVLLGLLLLENRFMKKTLRHKFFYEFTVLIALYIMKELDKYKFKGKKPMTCSQFAAQCYTDAGEMYDIRFNKLLIQFGVLNNNLLGENPTKGKTSLSLLEIIKNTHYNSSDNLKRSEKQEKENSRILENESSVIQNFWNLLNEETVHEEALLNEDRTSYAGQMLLNAISSLYNDNTLQADIDGYKNSTNRNYFVTPDDLYFNSSNLIYQGQLE